MPCPLFKGKHEDELLQEFPDLRPPDPEFLTFRNLIINIGNVISYVFMIVMNALISTKMFGATNADVSAKYPTLFTPAGYAFSIWGLIFYFLAVFTVYQALPRHRQVKDGILARLSFLIIVNQLLNGLWGVFFVLEYFWASMAIMTILLATLIAAYVRLDLANNLRAFRNGPGFLLLSGMIMSDEPEREELKAEETDENSDLNENPTEVTAFPHPDISSALQYWCVYIPISLYLAWICVASIANACIVSSSLGFPPSEWATVGLFVPPFLVAALLLFRAFDVAFGSVVCWALIAIAVKHGSDSMIVSYGAWVVGLFTGVMTLGVLGYRLFFLFRYYLRKCRNTSHI